MVSCIKYCAVDTTMTIFIVVVAKMQNTTGGANQDCVAAMPPDEIWKCGFSNVCSDI